MLGQQLLKRRQGAKGALIQRLLALLGPGVDRCIGRCEMTGGGRGGALFPGDDAGDLAAQPLLRRDHRVEFVSVSRHDEAGGYWMTPRLSRPSMLQRQGAPRGAGGTGQEPREVTQNAPPRPPSR